MAVVGSLSMGQTSDKRAILLKRVSRQFSINALDLCITSTMAALFTRFLWYSIFLGCTK